MSASWRSAATTAGINLPAGAMLASRGYSTLDLALCDAPGLPQHCTGHVSLEYFAKALRWLGRQQGIDPNRLWVMGASTGSEAALLLGVHYPNLVHGVVALSSDDAAECTIWTFGGQSVPCTGLIPVAKVQGPVFQDCGEYDSSGTDLRPCQDSHGRACRQSRPLRA